MDSHLHIKVAARKVELYCFRSCSFNLFAHQGSSFVVIDGSKVAAGTWVGRSVILSSAESWRFAMFEPRESMKTSQLTKAEKANASTLVVGAKNVEGDVAGAKGRWENHGAHDIASFVTTREAESTVLQNMKERSPSTVFRDGVESEDEDECHRRKRSRVVRVACVLLLPLLSKTRETQKLS